MKKNSSYLMKMYGFFSINTFPNLIEIQTFPVHKIICIQINDRPFYLYFHIEYYNIFSEFNKDQEKVAFFFNKKITL